jgi:septum formation inhibitor-activating ATPase MinD
MHLPLALVIEPEWNNQNKIVQYICNKPLLGKIPLFKKGEDYSSYYQGILNNLLSLNKRKTFLITSCWAGEGKSTTVFHLANLLSQNNKVVLINTDNQTKSKTLNTLIKNKSNNLHYYNSQVDILDSVFNFYDYFFIDCAPTLEYSNPITIINKIDSVIFLITDKEFPCYQLNRGSADFKDKVVGLIQNKCP